MKAHLAGLLAAGVIREQHEDLQVDLARGWATRFAGGQRHDLLGRAVA